MISHCLPVSWELPNIFNLPHLKVNNASIGGCRVHTNLKAAILDHLTDMAKRHI